MSDIKTVLIVDDDEALLSALVRKFEQLHCKISVARDGDEALKLLNEKHFDALLTDIHMPNKSGLELLKEVKNTMNANISSYVITNLGSDHYCTEAKEYGALECFVKSRITLSEVVEVVRSALS